MATILATDETGALVLSARVLGHETVHARYVVEAQGETLTLRPEATLSEPAKSTETVTKPDEWQSEWDAWSDEVTKAWRSDKSATEIVAEMRR